MTSVEEEEEEGTLLVHSDEDRWTGVRVDQFDGDMIIFVHFDLGDSMMLHRIDRIDAENEQRHGGVIVDLHNWTENDASTIVVNLSIAQQLNRPIGISRWTDVIDTFPGSVDANSLHHLPDLVKEKSSLCWSSQRCSSYFHGEFLTPSEILFFNDRQSSGGWTFVGNEQRNRLIVSQEHRGQRRIRRELKHRRNEEWSSASSRRSYFHAVEMIDEKILSGGIDDGQHRLIIGLGERQTFIVNIVE